MLVAKKTSMASWYAPGGTTASGIKYAPGMYGVAHRTLPFGTVVEITNLQNGKSVVVKVIDRGPAVWTGRNWDLTQAAARQIDMISAGVVPVSVRLLNESGIGVDVSNVAATKEQTNAVGAALGFKNIKQVGQVSLLVLIAYMLYRTNEKIGIYLLSTILLGSLIANLPNLKANWTGKAV